MEKAKMETEKSKKTSNVDRRHCQCEKSIFSCKSYKELKCEKCISWFKSYMELKYHGQSANEGKNGSKCYICETVLKKSCLWQKDRKLNQNSPACTILTLTWHQSMKKQG